MTLQEEKQVFDKFMDDFWKLPEDARVFAAQEIYIHTHILDDTPSTKDGRELRRLMHKFRKDGVICKQQQQLH